MEKHYRKMIYDAEQRVLRRLQTQIMDGKSPWYGAFPDVDGIVQAKYSIYSATTLISCYFCEDSRYFGDSLVYERILLALDYIRRVQHENGLFDYVTCNFNSAPDTAFCIKRLIPTYEYLKKYSGTLTAEAAEICKRTEAIIHDGGRGLLEGGFHTPNHRWAIASLLATCSRLFDEEDLMKAAFVYLNEGIDCNEDGEFAEKSAGNYNRVNNDAMIMLTEATGDPMYEDCALRNLKMMLTYWEPDDSVFTANSTRFDKDHLCWPKDYYMEFLRMGIKHDIPEFIQMANRIFEIVDEKHITSPDSLTWLLLYPELRAYEYEGSYHQPDFERMYEDSGIVRRHTGRYTYTIMRGKSNFFYFHNGTIKLEMKVAGSFCEHRAFKAQTLEKLGAGEYHLQQIMRGWYYLPFEEKPETSDWWKMDNKSRKMKMGPDMQIDVWVKEADCGVDIRVKTSGVEGAPWRIELAFTGLNYLSNDHLECPVTGGEVLVLKDGTVKCSNATDALLVGPAFGEHRFTEGKEDSELRTPGAATLYFTDYTGFDHTIQIRDENSLYFRK